MLVVIQRFCSDVDLFMGISEAGRDRDEFFGEAKAKFCLRDSSLLVWLSAPFPFRLSFGKEDNSMALVHGRVLST